MKRALLATLLLIFLGSLSAFAGEVPTKAAKGHTRAMEPNIQAGQPNGTAHDSDIALPRISKFQMPRVVALDEYDDPLNKDLDGGGDGYVEGACNCSRICYEGRTGCNISVPNNGCQANSGKPCDSCSWRC